MSETEDIEKVPPKSPPPPPNFEPEQIIQEDLSLEPPEIHEAQKKQKRQELEIAAKNPPEINFHKKVIPGKERPQYKPQFKPTQISPVKMEDAWKGATNEKGRPPIGGALDD